MNLITKLLMENETTVITLPSTCAFHVSGERTDIVVVVPKCVYDVDTKKELLSEILEQYYVSTLEWMLLNYWQENDIKQISADKSGNLTLWHGPYNSDYDEFYMNWATNKLFQFLEVNKFYALSDLINRCALIEG